MTNSTYLEQADDSQLEPLTIDTIGDNTVIADEECNPDLVPVNAVRVDGGTQARAEIDAAVVAEYAEALRSGTKLPPAVLFFDGTAFWLADGFHRYYACMETGDELLAIIRMGTRRDAVLYAVGANAGHGLRRTNEDKRRAVKMLLEDAEWATWSDREIARTCCVSNNFVSEVRKASICHPMTDAATGTGTGTGTNISPTCDAMPVSRMVKRNGKTYQQKVAKIGKSEAQLPDRNPSSSAEELAPTIETAGADTLATLRSANTELRQLLDKAAAEIEVMRGVFNADDQLKSAMDEVARQRAFAETARRATAYWKDRAEKAEKPATTAPELDAPAPVDIAYEL